MKKIRIAINGFGRIGRLVLRVCTSREDVQVVAINDPFIDAEYGKYLFLHDSIHGHFDCQCNAVKDKLVVNGNEIAFYNEKEPSLIPWKNHNVDVVVESSGKFTKHEDAVRHIQAGAKKVVVTAPGKNMPMFVMGVNHKNYKKNMLVVSNASCTTNCLAPLAKVINDNFGIEWGFMSTVHSATATQLTVDGPSKKDWRGGRAASYNIIPSSTGAAKSIGQVLPELDGLLTGNSYRVPTLDCSVIDFVCSLKKPTTLDEIASAITKASKKEMKGVMGITDDAVVSSDFIGDSRTCIYDKNGSLMLNPRAAKLMAWYDNEWGYSNKTVDLCVHISK